ncbi:GDP-mannose transporter into the lumen of the Golgi [Tulasnella sp. 424]|nr:GDP-mannose transporter into the lumen of the Golgi [Tulasnella sp. 424]KAG8974029.1 GDP-mannose transporter into the lumen of the Golgi [Tulasnella sp. 425]
MTATPPRRNSGALSPRITSGFNLNTDSKQKDLSSNVNRDDDIVELKKNAGANNDNSGLTAALPVVSYCIASIMMTVVNKFVVSGAHFSMNFLLLAMQSIVCIGCVVVSKRFGLISFRDFDAEDAKRWFPISFLLVCVIYTGSKSLQFLSIPVYTIFKNLTIILIAYGEVLWFGGAVTNLTLCSFVLMVVSSIVAAWSDISTTFSTLSGAWSDPAAAAAQLPNMSHVMGNLNAGYVWMLLNCCVSAAYVLTMRKRIKSTGFKDWDTMYYNNLLSIPVLVIFSFLAEDWGIENLNRNFPAETRTILLAAIAFSGAAAVGISFTTAWCIRATSSTTYSMVGALNKLPVAASGMIFFGDPVTLGSVSAVSLGFVAGIVYALAKNIQSKAEKARAGPAPLPMYRKP